MKFFLCLVGMILIVEGLPYFVFPGQMKKWLGMLMLMEDGILRSMALFLMISGLCIVYAVMKVM